MTTKRSYATLGPDGLLATAQTPSGVSGEHPDAQAHQALGLSPTHTHDFAGTGHNHDAAYSATAHGHAAHNHDGSYAAPHAHPYSSDLHAHAGVYEPAHSHPDAATSYADLDADIPAGIARDAEVTSAIATHAATPHGGGAGPWTTVVKTADESHNASAVVTDDALLKFTTLPNTAYTIRLRASS